MKAGGFPRFAAELHRVFMTTFADLAASRREWIDRVLQPWCQQAQRKDLLQAELEWPDIAGRPAAELTLWLWAWSRFPGLVQEGLTAINETHRVTVTLRDGTQHCGYPDARRSQRGQLVLLNEKSDWTQPISIDDIHSVTFKQT